MKLPGTVAANTSTVGGNRSKFQPETGKNTTIGGVHRIIGLLQRSLVNMKRISVLHQEFTRTHNPEARSYLVAELRLDLEIINR